MSFVERLFSNKWGACLGFQICIIFITASGAILSYKQEKYGDGLPIFSIGTGYVFAWIVLVWMWLKGKGKWWNILFVTLFIVPGDCCGCIAYSQTSLASAMLIITTVIFRAAPLAYIFFKRKINWIQFLSMLLGMGGVSMVMVAQGTKGSKLKGNLFALGASLLYSFGTMFQEKCSKEYGPILYTCRFTSLAIPFTFALSAGLERNAIKNYHWDTTAIALQVAYSVAIGTNYIVMAFILKYSDATVMNLNNLTGNFYSLAVDIFFFGRPFNWLYLLGFFCIPIAVIIFLLCESKPKKDEIPDDRPLISAYESTESALDESSAQK